MHADRNFDFLAHFKSLAVAAERPVEWQDVTATSFLIGYLKGEEKERHMYDAMVTTLDNFKNLDELGRAQCLHPYFSAVDYVTDQRCFSLLKGLLWVPWLQIPPSLNDKYSKFLVEVALRRMSLMELVVQACVRNFRPYDPEDPVSDLNRQYWLAHSTLVSLNRCTQSAEMVILRALQRRPHHSLDCPVILNHLRNQITVGEYLFAIRGAVWAALTDQLIEMDALVTKCYKDPEFGAVDARNFFIYSDELVMDTTLPEKVLDLMTKLDACMVTVFEYIAVTMNKDLPNYPTWVHLGPEMEILDLLADSFSLCLLKSRNTHMVAFIWLYVCVLSEPRTIDLWLNNLWRFTVDTARTSADQGRCQSCVGYLGAVVARATFISTGMAFEWLRKLKDWLMEYVEAQAKLSSPVLVNHGNYYAITEAFMLIFCYHYVDLMQDTEYWEMVNGWNIRLFIYCPLEPLKFITRPVAETFHIIARNLNVIYNPDGYQFDATAGTVLTYTSFFPLGRFHLPESFVFFKDYLRVFSPRGDERTLFDPTYKKPGTELQEEVTQDESTAEEEPGTSIEAPLDYDWTTIEEVDPRAPTSSESASSESIESVFSD
ncbi:unnamed protein product, partial [Mesorhabditis spiculigera]